MNSCSKSYGLELCEEAKLEAQMFNLVQMSIRLVAVDGFGG